MNPVAREAPEVMRRSVFRVRERESDDQATTGLKTPSDLGQRQVRRRHGREHLGAQNDVELAVRYRPEDAPGEPLKEREPELRLTARTDEVQGRAVARHASCHGCPE